ncbi:MAG: DUF2244 domain-containing protein [Pseudomonadota bacterium]
MPPTSIGRAGPVDEGDGATGALFDAVLSPNRSLRPAGFFLVMAIVVGVSFTAGVYFMSLGAWPVTGFFGLDALLVYIAFRLSYRQGRMREEVLVRPGEMIVRRIMPSGHEKRWTLNPFWVRVRIDRPVEHHSQLKLVSHGRTLILGAFLAPEERGELAEALGDALETARAPGL